jgi:hypothetical protein
MDETRLWNESQPNKYYWETPRGFFLQELNQRSYKNEKYSYFITVFHFAKYWFEWGLYYKKITAVIVAVLY